MLEELKNLRKRNEELIYNDKECQTNTAKINQLEGELNTLRDQSSVLNDNIDKCNDDNLTMLEELKNLRKRNEELIYNDKECQTNTAKINQLEGELNTLRDQSSVLNAQNIKLKQESEAKNQQLQKHLPNLDVPKVSIIEPALKGTGDNKYLLLLLFIFA